MGLLSNDAKLPLLIQPRSIRRKLMLTRPMKWILQPIHQIGVHRSINQSVVAVTD
jgi:hypothetical protein